MPLLAATFTVIALYGAQLIGVQQMGVDVGAFWSQTQNAVDLRDVREGVVKSLVFGVAVQPRRRLRGLQLRADARRRGPRDHAHRRHFLGAGAAVELSADRRVPNYDTDRINVMKNTRSLEIGTGLFVLLGFAALAFLTTQLPGTSLKFGSGDGGYTVTARFDNIGDLKPGSPVTMAGVHVGRVESIRFDPKDFKAAVVLRIENQYSEIPEDSDASIQTAGLLGGKYVGIGPGGSETFLKDGGQIEFTQSAIVLESLVNKFFANMASKGPDETEERRAGEHRSRNDAVDEANRSGWVHRRLC